MKCFIEKEFEYSDGLDVQNKTAYVGTVVDIPTEYVAGLSSEGYVSDPDLQREDPSEPLSNKDAGAAPENAANLVGANAGTNVPEGFKEDFEAAQTVPDIPEDWEELSAKDIHALATSLTGFEYPNKPAASEAIAAFIAEGAA
jgi:hypothetical protein